MLLLLTSAMIGAATPLPPPSSPLRRGSIAANGRCEPPTMTHEAGRSGGRAKFRRLNELPPADAYKAVYRTINGCVAPVVVKYGLGKR